MSAPAAFGMTRHLSAFHRCAAALTRFLAVRVPGPLTRILSDIHYGDRASRVSALAQLRPLMDGVDELVLNGDTLDTRPGPRPGHTTACRAGVLEFVATNVPHTTILTGNHDPDFSAQHAIELAGGQVVATHGDIVFDDLVPWGRDSSIIRPKIAAVLAALPPHERQGLAPRFAAWRQVAASIPQRHQSEPHGFKYAFHFAADTLWPPLRVVRILRAWHIYPALVAEFARVHWPKAKFITVGHTHRPGIWTSPAGVTIINTGSFCPPLGGYAVDVEPHRVVVRAVKMAAGEFRPARVVAEFPLAAR